LLSGVVVLLASVVSQAQDPTPPPLPKQPLPLPTPGDPPKLNGPLGFNAELLSAKALERLKLTKEQRADYDKLEEEFKKKQREAQGKVFDPSKAPDPAAIKDSFEAMRKVRPEYLAKVEKLLNEDQKKTLEQIRGEVGFGQGGFTPLFPQVPGPLGHVVGAPFLPAEAQKKLNLTDDQKKKVDELQKELESKIMGLLTDEQKKAFEEMKKRPFGIGPNPPLPIPLPLPDPPKLDVPKLEVPKLEVPKLEVPKVEPPKKQVNPTLPAVEPTRPPEVRKLDK
jgi:Spy/CpxP family protein refolding chaperone